MRKISQIEKWGLKMTVNKEKEKRYVIIFL